MTDQLNGLRFDIYERVHLPDDVAAIEELEEIELVPHMQALPQDDQVLLRGHLLLTGVYQSQGGAGLSQLEHWIPVEIALPLNRIQSVEELAVEIDNFDVDLLTTRSLNVTGVLALRGLQMQSVHSPVWRDDSFTVVHQAQPDGAENAENVEDAVELRAIEPEASLEFGDVKDVKQAKGDRDVQAAEQAEDTTGEASFPGAELVEQERVDEWGLQQETDAAFAHDASKEGKETKESSWLSMFQQLEEARSDQNDTAQAALDAANLSDGGDGGVVQWGDLSTERPAAEQQAEDGFGLAANAEVGSEALPSVESQLSAVEEKPDLRVALGGKPLESAAPSSASGVGLLSQLGDKGAKREALLRSQEAAEAEQQQMESASAQSARSGDEIEWTRLFLSGGSEGQSFRKVKMCIVQREETLEAIASRYNLQMRELQLYNRLQEPYLSEGQVLYIP